jgi:hypothetical protein
MNSSLEDKPDVLPPWANRLMILLWLLLFGGRWLILTPMEWTGAISPDTMSFLDDVLLLRVYLLLFVVTCVVIGLRFARSVSSATPTEAGDPQRKTS